MAEARHTTVTVPSVASATPAAALPASPPAAPPASPPASPPAAPPASTSAVQHSVPASPRAPVSPVASPTPAPAPIDNSLEEQEEALADHELPEFVRELDPQDVEVVRRVAKFVPALRRVLRAACKESDKKNSKLDISPPIRGSQIGLVPLTFLQWLLQCVSLGHYLSEPEEAATFFFAVKGKDWITAGWHLIFDCFRSAILSCSRGRCACACPRFRRLGRSSVAWDPGLRKLRGTPSSDDELGTLKVTFALLALWAIADAAFVFGMEIVGDVPGVSFRPPAVWRLQWGSGFSWLAWSTFGVVIFAMLYICHVIAGLTLYPVRLAGTRPSSLPTLMSLLVRASAPQFMISYAWGGRSEQSLKGLALGLAEALPDCWIDVRRLVSGQHVRDEVCAPAEHARVLVVLMNEAYVKSENCCIELLAALTKRTENIHRTVILIEAENEVRGWSPNWEGISASLQKAGKGVCVVRSVEDLLTWLDLHACRHRGSGAKEEQEERAATLAWFAKYYSEVAEAVASAQDQRLPWNFFSKPTDWAFWPRAGKTTTHKMKEMKTFSLFLEPTTYLAAFCAATFCCRRPSRFDTTTGLGGCYIAANAATPFQPHAEQPYRYPRSWSPSVVSTFLIGLFAPVLILLFLLFFRFDPSANGITGGELLAYVLNEIGAALFLVFFSIAPLLVFAVRWGDVLAAPTSLLHSPELFVPLLVRELQLPHNVKPGKSGSGTATHKKPSNCSTIADNISAFLGASGVNSDIIFFDTFLGDHSAGKLDKKAVYVIMLEIAKNAKDCIELLERMRREPTTEDPAVILVTSDRFFADHPELHEWLVIEFKEDGADNKLSRSGTASDDHSLVAQVFNAISMKLVTRLNILCDEEVTTAATVATAAFTSRSSNAAVIAKASSKSPARNLH